MNAQSLGEAIWQCLDMMGMQTRFEITIEVDGLLFKFERYPWMNTRIPNCDRINMTGRDYLDKIFRKVDVDRAQHESFMRKAVK